ncbi:MAG TPA: LysR family transcriptional regulator [Devosiaceae bacterium]|jgi:LysR family nitrogen assimilation transcriptional regulator
MKLNQLTYLVTIANYGSLSKAAAVLGVAQPTLSRQLRDLEDEVGVPLLYRHGRGTSPTEHGAAFVDAIKPHIEGILQAKADLRASLEIPSGEISLGIPPSLSAGIGAALVRNFCTHYPQIKLHILEGFSGFVNEWLVNGRVDMAILNAARRTASVQMEPLITEDLFLLGKGALIGDLANDKGEIPTRALNGMPLVLPGRHHGLRRTLDAATQRLGFEVTAVLEIDSLVALKELVSEGRGMAVLPGAAIASSRLGADMRVLRIVDPPLQQSFMIAFSLHKPMTPGLRALARAIRFEVDAALKSGRLVGHRPIQEKDEETGALETDVTELGLADNE